LETKDLSTDLIKSIIDGDTELVDNRLRPGYCGPFIVLIWDTNSAIVYLL